jgi:hypothetical protein
MSSNSQGHMKKSLFSILIFINLSLFAQKGEFLDGEIVDIRGDTIIARIKKLNRFQSFYKVIYKDSSDEIKRLPVDSLRYYKRGSEVYENLILSSEVLVLAKRIVRGPEMSLYIRDRRESFNKRIFNEAVGKNMPKVFQIKFLKDKNNNILNFTYSSKRKLKKFITSYQEVIEKIENKELTTVEEIVVECNNGKY